MDTAAAVVQPPVAIALINQLPAILTACAALAAALFSLRNGRKTDKVEAKTDAIGVKADAAAVSAEVAAGKAADAAVKAQEVHETTKAIAEQTNGHLTRLTDDVKRLTLINEGLQATVVTLTGVLHARQVRRTDLVRSALGEMVPAGSAADRQDPDQS